MHLFCALCADRLQIHLSLGQQCGLCQFPLHAIRNHPLEHVAEAQALKIPCPFGYCKEELTVGTEATRAHLLLECPHKIIKCPWGCKWRGTARASFDHVIGTHAEVAEWLDLPLTHRIKLYYDEPCEGNLYFLKTPTKRFMVYLNRIDIEEEDQRHFNWYAAVFGVDWNTSRVLDMSEQYRLPIIFDFGNERYADCATLGVDPSDVDTYLDTDFQADLTGTTPGDGHGTIVELPYQDKKRRHFFEMKIEEPHKRAPKRRFYEIKD